MRTYKKQTLWDKGLSCLHTHMERERYCANISPKRKPTGNKEARVCGARAEETITVTTIASHLKAARAEYQSKHGRGRQISVAMVLNILRSPKKTTNKSSEVRRTHGPLVPGTQVQPKPQYRSQHNFRDSQNANNTGVSPCKGKGR